MTVRKYTSRSQQTTLSSAVTSGATVLSVTNASTLLAGTTISAGQTFVVVIDPDTALEEIVEITSASSNNLTVTRAVDMSGASAQDHSSGAVVRHMIIGRDLRESNLHIEATGAYNDGTSTHAMHGLGSSDGVVVGTTATQTLTAKTLTSPVITNPSISGAGVDASIVFEGTTADAFETTLTVVDPTQDNTITLPNTTGTVAILTATQTMTNKTLTSPIISGSPVITGLSSAGMSASSAAPKDYVDSILGSATSAATSAASAAASATAAATSASSAATSASLAATSASSASTSQTAAATSAASAATSATAAATSATSAAASATTAANSVAAIASYATTAANSASAAATSATSAAASQSAALTSANSAATSASTMASSVTAAATSAASAATSATAAATSATSAAASATAANTSAINAAASESAVAASAAAAATSATSASASATAAATSASSASTSASSALTSQTAAATSATSAAASATAAATSATNAAASYDSFDDRYLGAKSSPPSVDNDGNALLTGALYWNTSVNKMYVWSGSAWAEISSSADIIAYKYTVAGGATSVSGPDDNSLTLSYSVGKEQVYINGVLQVRGSDYTASTGSSITGMLALTANDIVTVLAFTAFSVSNTYTQAEADAKFFQNTNAFVAGKNKIINGDFFVNQRAFTSTTADQTYIFDRYRTRTVDGTVTFSAQTFTPGTAPVAGYEGKNYLRIVTSGQTLTSAITNLQQLIESVTTLAGQTATVSFWAKANTGTPKMSVEFTQNFGSGGSALLNTYAGQVTLSTSWARYSVTVSVPSINGKTIGTSDCLELKLFVSAGSDFNSRTGSLGIQTNTFDLWGVQVEAGSVSTAFQTATGTIQGELAACQRYYYRNAPIGNAFSWVGQGWANNTLTSALIGLQMPVPMRTTPTAIDYSTLGVVWYNGATTVASLAISGESNNYIAKIDITTSSNLPTAGMPIALRGGGLSGYFGLSAEL
jgi:hypothetical protein